MHNIKRKIMGSLMAVLMGASSVCGTCPAPIFAVEAPVDVTADAMQVAANNYGLASATEGNILHAWNWSYNVIKDNMKDIAEAGYSVVQTSPAQVSETVSDNWSWWKAYQPYDYAMADGKSASFGTKAEFKAMCEEADKYGVSVIVDAVVNHVAGENADVKPGVVDFWKTGNHLRGGNNVFDGNKHDLNRLANVTYHIGVPDINTENQEVQDRLATYLGELMDLGADGIRFDAAKHIGTSSDQGECQSSFWKNAVAAVKAKKSDALVYGEILNIIPVSDKYYVNDGIKITDSQQGWNMKDLVRGGKKASDKASETTKSGNAALNAFSYSRDADNKDIISWVENHDTYLNYWGSTGLSGHANYMSDDQVMLAWSTVAARADVQSLFFARPDGCSAPRVQGTPSNDDTNYIEGSPATLTKNTTWKNEKVASINKFKNAMVGESEELSANGDVAIIKRGTKGVVVTNFGGSEASFDVSGLSGMADGEYKDASGQNGSFTVSDGKVSGKVKGKTFVVLYTEKEVPTTTIDPTETATTTDAPSETATISVDKKDGTTFTDAMNVKVTAKNAEKAFYSYDGADWEEFTGTATVAVGKEKLVAGDEVGLYVAAYGKDKKLVKESYTYKKASEAGSTSTTTAGANTITATLPSGWSSLNIYAYLDGAEATKLTGEWPGTPMDKGADGNYTYTLDNAKEGTNVIFNDGNNQVPPQNQGGLAFTPGKAYKFDGSKLVEVEVATATDAPTGTKKATEPKTWPEVVVEDETATVVSASVKSGESFDEETLEVTVTAKNADSAYYTIDGGVKKAFTDKATVQVGEGKIADTEVTLEVVAVKDGKETKETYKYKKVFNQEKAAKAQNVKTAAVRRIQSLMGVVEEAAQVNAGSLSNDSLDASYQTNTVGLGKKTSITVDESISDWDESMLIAKGNANDDPRVYRPNSMYEVPIDAYALYGAYDDKNLYLMWEMTNVQDVVAPNDDFPLTQGTMFKNMNIPFFIAIDNGKEDTTSTKCATSAGGTVWDSGITISQNVNRLIAISTNGANGPFVYNVDSSGLDTVEKYSKQGGGKSGAAASGIQFGYGTGILSKEVIGINGAYGENNKRVVGDVCDGSADRVDFNTKGHNSEKMDYHYEIAIPYEELGVSASDVESNGLGVMVIATSGKSGMDCLPYDVAMNDQADMDDSAGSQENNSFEKSDEDNITASFARIAVGEVQTARPTKQPSTSSDTTATKEPTTEATAKPEVTPTASASTTSGSAVTTDKFVVNFGADKAAPQEAGTTLELKAVPYNADGTCEYEFAVDGKTVQEYSDKDSYSWKTPTGAHKISVSVKDAKGNVITVEKNYTLEGEVVEEATATPTTAPTQTPVITKEPQPTTMSAMTVAIQFSKKNKCAINTKVKMQPVVSKYQESYMYTIAIKKIDGTVTSLVENSTKKAVYWTPKKKGTYNIIISATDSKGNVATETYTYKVTKLGLSASVSAKSVKRGKTVTIKAKPSTATGTVKYQYVIKKGSKKIKTVKYTTKKSYKWKVSKKSKKGTYTVTVSAKDSSKVVVSKSIKIKVK